MLGLNLGINKGITKNKYRTLAKSCDMLTATTDLETDRVGITLRAAVRGVEIIGDGNTYLTADINVNNYFDVVCEFSEPIPLGAWKYILDARTTENQNGGYIAINPSTGDIETGQGSSWTKVGNRYNVENVLFNTNIITFFARHTIGDAFTENVLFLELYNRDTNVTYTLDNTNRNNEYILVPDDNSESIICQQFLAPAQPTQENIEVVSMADSYGYTIADGTQYYDVAGTKQIPIGSVIPNYKDGVTSTAYIGGVHPDGVFVGRCKYDFTSDGTIIQLADNYHEIAKYDTTRILTEADGTPKILTLENIALVTNNQLYYNQDLKIGFFKESLTGDCHEKANKMFEQRVERLSDSDLVQLSDSEGEKLYSLV